MTDWLLRPYDPATDEDGVLFTFLQSYATSEAGKRLGAHHRETPAARSFWDDHRGFFLSVLGSSVVTVACDPERPDVMYGWIAADGPTLHYALVKRAVVQLGFGVELLRDLLGDMTREPTAYTLEPVELGRLYAAAARGQEWPVGHKVEPIFPREEGRIVRLPRSWYADYTFFQRQRRAA